MLHHMGKLMVLAVGLSLSAMASAQGQAANAADAKYCAELTRLYRTYINNPEDPRPAQISPSVEYDGRAIMTEFDEGGALPLVKVPMPCSGGRPFPIRTDHRAALGPSG